MIKWKGIVWTVHPLFVMVMLASLATGYMAEMMTLFLIVVVHELGHVMAARSFGWTIREVKLLPFGGVAEAEEASGASAKEDALVAIAGPLQNGWMALAAWACGWLGWWDGEWASYVVQANLMIGLFNLLPIYPLDGGKLLQALFSLFVNYYGMLVWSSRISLLLSVLMTAAAFAPLWLNDDGVQLNLLVVGVFLTATNWNYARSVPFLFYRFLVHRERLADRESDRGRAVAPLIVHAKQSIWSVARLFNREKYHLVYVIDHAGKQLRVLPEQSIVGGCLSGFGPHRAVWELLR